MKNKDYIEATVSSMGRKRIINVPVKSDFKIGDKVRVFRSRKVGWKRGEKEMNTKKVNIEFPLKKNKSWWATGNCKEPEKRKKQEAKKGEWVFNVAC